MLQTRGNLSPQITKKMGFVNRKSVNICGRYANLAKYLGLQIFGFAICRTYLQTAYLCQPYVADHQFSSVYIHMLVLV
jgi:hypothetical protein